MRLHLHDCLYGKPPFIILFGAFIIRCDDIVYDNLGFVKYPDKNINIVTHNHIDVDIVNDNLGFVKYPDW